MVIQCNLRLTYLNAWPSTSEGSGSEMGKRTEKDVEREIWLVLLKAFHRSAIMFLKGLTEAIKLTEREQ